MAGEGTNKGWISIYRKVEDGWLWEDKPFARGQAWIDLLLQANHKGKKTFSKGELIEIKRGSFLTSDQELGDRWGWSRKKVRGFLEVLEREQMVTLERSPKGTSLTIENYSLYQNRGTTEDTAEEQQKICKGNGNGNIVNEEQVGALTGTEKGTSLTIENSGVCQDCGTTEEQLKIQQKNNRGTTEEQQKNTNNNVNNINNDNNGNKGIREEPPQPLPILSNPSRIENIIIDNFGEVAYSTWFLDCKIEEHDKLISFKAPSEFKRNMITRKYKETLELLSHKEIVIKVGD